jgi:hypothetical protein
MSQAPCIESNSLKSKDAFVGLIAELNAEIALMEQEQEDTKTDVGAAGRLVSLMQEHSGPTEATCANAPKGYGAALLAMEQRLQPEQL